MGAPCCARGDVRLLIATDVAARGIDINELPEVINMTMPDSSKDYIHRWVFRAMCNYQEVGAGASGCA